MDCGITFGSESLTPGVDIIMPDIRFLAEHRDNVLGIIATHAHEDHIGAIAPSMADAEMSPSMPRRLPRA